MEPVKAAPASEVWVERPSRRKVEVLSVQAYIWCPSCCSAGIGDAVDSILRLIST